MNRNVENRKYKVVRAKLPSKAGTYIDRWLIIDNLIPCEVINQWIENKSLRKISTGREYANKLVVFLNYLDKKGKYYYNAKKYDVNDFILYLIYRDDFELTIKNKEEFISFGTLNGYINSITEFYKWLEEHYENEMELSTKIINQKAKKRFLYGQIWKADYKVILTNYIKMLRGSRDYLKWYKEEEKDALCSNFKTLRDCVIFLITLEGFRIDEVLSMCINDYDSFNRSIKPRRSKGKLDDGVQDNNLRRIVLPGKTCALIDRYINTERLDAEYESNKLSDLLFINLKKGKSQGEALTYRCYWEILKRCASRAGLEASKIRTHSGRSTKAMEMLEHQVEFPEDGITDAIIAEHFGWSKIDMIKYYRNNNNQIVAKSVAEKIHGRKFNKCDSNSNI